MLNSFLRTSTGLSILITGKSYTIQHDHHNYKAVVQAIANKDWNSVPGLINQVDAVVKYITNTTLHARDLSVNANAGHVTFRGMALPEVITTSILNMARDGFSIEPMALFLSNLYDNPSNKAIDQLFGWMTANGITISEDGFLLAFKRVRDDMKSFYDGKTNHIVGQRVEMPRNQVDDRSEMTCSHGLHFCAQSYLPSYAGGQGNVLLLKINPADVVSIPTDYNFAKGRACRYTVLDVLRGDARTGVEERNVIPQPVVTKETDYNQSDSYKIGYRAGYKDGRGKKAKYSTLLKLSGFVNDGQLKTGYDAGFLDGRTKQPNLYGGEVLKPEQQAKETVMSQAHKKIQDRVIHVFADQLGLRDTEVKLNHNIVADLGADSLDLVELVMYMEDEFSIEITDEEAEDLLTVGATVDFVIKRLDNGRV